MKMLVLLMVMVVLAGCATGTQYGYFKGIGNGGKQMAEYADPSRPVHPGQISREGINGMSGPYAAAIGLGSIPDSNARADAKEAILAISENENSWGTGDGSRRELGRIKNSYQFPITVVIQGVARWDIVAEGCVAVPIPMISGVYRAEIYKTGQTRPFTHRTFSLRSEGRVVGDQVYFFDEVI